jgi:ABC-type transport system substrate-binding protein
MLTSQTVPSQASEDNSLKSGPYVDGVTFSVIEDAEQMIVGLQSGTIDMHAGFLTESQVQSLTSADSNITGNQVVRNGYGLFTINCRDYPLNISALRRAFAFAFDKTRIRNEVFNGSTAVHDSLIPTPNEFCIESNLPYRYYDAKPEEGNKLLDAAGFEIDGGTGWRKAPNGAPFNLTIEYDPSYRSWSADIAEIAVDAFLSLFIDAHSLSTDINEIYSRLDSHGDFDIVIQEYNFQDNAVFYLDDFLSESAVLPYRNPCNFRNSTLDLYIEQLQHSATHEEVFAAASEIQHILHEQVPQLVCYEYIRNQAYRTDLFTEHVNDLVKGISSSWTLRKVRSIGGSHGGMISVGIFEDPESFNMFVTESFSTVSYLFMDLLYPSLYDSGPTLKPVQDLAKNLTAERNVDNPDVPVGHIRYIIDIVENATWSDGTPLTAHDVNFTFQLVINQHVNVYGGDPLPIIGTLPLIATDVPSLYRIVMDFDRESYRDFSRFAFGFIIPEHIFSDESFNWYTWDPVFDAEAPFVTCGPFLLGDFEVNNFYSLVNNPEFHFSLNQTESITTEPTISRPWGLLTYLAISVSTVSLVTIFVSATLIKRRNNQG